MPPRRAGDVDAIGIRGGANVFECELERDRHQLAWELELIDSRDGAGRRRRPNRLLGGDRADAVPPSIGHRHRVDQAQAERPLRDEPCLIAFYAILRQLGRPAAPGQRPAVGRIRSHRELDIGGARDGDALCRVEQLAGGGLVAAGRRGERIRVPDAARDRLQARRHHRKRAANVAIDPRPDRRIVRAEHDAFRDPAGCNHREHADPARQRDPEHTARRRVHNS